MDISIWFLCFVFVSLLFRLALAFHTDAHTACLEIDFFLWKSELKQQIVVRGERKQSEMRKLILFIYVLDFFALPIFGLFFLIPNDVH